MRPTLIRLRSFPCSPRSQSWLLHRLRWHSGMEDGAASNPSGTRAGPSNDIREIRNFAAASRPTGSTGRGLSAGSSIAPPGRQPGQTRIAGRGIVKAAVGIPIRTLAGTPVRILVGIKVSAGPARLVPQIGSFPTWFQRDRSPRPHPGRIPRLRVTPCRLRKLLGTLSASC